MRRRRRLCAQLEKRYRGLLNLFAMLSSPDRKMINEKEAGKLLDKLCVKLGFCLPPDDIARIKKNPPSDAIAFTDVVFIAEGLDPTTADRHLYRQVRNMVADAFWQAECEEIE